MERIEPILSSTGQWTPTVGRETLDLLRYKGFADSNGQITQAGQMIQQEAVRIMEVCGNPEASEYSETGLVIGYVQSGKTLSFTTMTALAHDNGYQIVIIIAGTSTALLEQSTARIRQDLRLDVRTDRKWSLLKNPGAVEERNAISTAIHQWADTTYDRSSCRTILITVMKHGTRLDHLTRILGEFDLTGVPILIIDDEGDQASMNTRARAAARSNVHISESEWSTIYRRINELRSVLPHHTYLQYTATPQAPLFINIMDRLSPNFIKLLTPGEDYTGGQTFFVRNPNLVRAIPISEIGAPTAPLQEAPESLREALRIFFIGVAAGRMAGSQGNRSMMVHPSRLQGDHARYSGFVNNIVGSWRQLLTSNSQDDQEDKQHLQSEFRRAYQDLALTVDDLPTFEELSLNSLRHAVESTRIIEVNSSRGSTPQIPWRDEYSFILVGGQAMDRGFTVEGLTITYMPRGIGTGNVDTIQQRARFFGYKRRYLGYCRVYVDQPTIDSYQAIVEHEEDIRSNLIDFDVSNLPLNDWQRRAVLDTMLNLTRRNVLYDELDRHTFGDEWFSIKAPHDTERYIETNLTTLSNYVSARSGTFQPDQGDNRRTIEQRNLTTVATLADCLDNFLNELKFTRERDSAEFTSFKSIMRMQLEQNPNEPCQIYLMSTQSTDIDRWEPRTRSINVQGEIKQLFQGSNARTGFPGQREVKNIDIITVQVYLLTIPNVAYERIPTVAIWVPERMSRSLISPSSYDNMSLLKLFQSLDKPDEGTFNAIRVSPVSMQRIARNDKGNPCILLTCRDELGSQSNISLQYLKVYHRVSCAISEGSQLNHETFTVIAFENGDSLLHEYFLRISESLIASLPERPTDKHVIEVIYKYVEVLRMLSEPPRKSVQGLWAELLLILESEDIATILNWWHSSPEAKYDFDSGNLKLEVKSSVGSERKHHFSLEQISSKSHQVIVISILMRSATTGSSIENLRQKIASRLNGNVLLLQKLDLVIARTLGRSVHDAVEITYDYNWAKGSIRCYPSESIPKITLSDVPKGVSEVRFKVDMEFALSQPYKLDYLQSIVAGIVNKFA